MWNSQVVYTALGTNRFSNAADVSNSCVAIASGSWIGLWDTADDSDQGIFATLAGHKHLITCVFFVSEKCLASADEEGFLILWQKNDCSMWSISSTTRAHDHSISCIASLGSTLMTGSSDSLVKVWNIESTQEPVLSQTISLLRRYPLSLALSKLPGSEALLLAVSGTDRNVQLWLNSDDEFSFSSSLSGHEDWVKSLSFHFPDREGEPLILASGSNDATIRLWNIQRHTIPRPSDLTITAGHLSDELLDAFEASLGEVAEAEDGGRQISLKRHMLSLKDGTKYAVIFDALLLGHDAGITRLSWGTSNTDSPITLMSTSTDSSVILWAPAFAPSSETSLWINQQRFGDIGGQRLGGFVGGLWARNGREVLAWGWSGSWRRWRQVSQNSWEEVGAISGHGGPVKSVAWCQSGDYFISTGVDQTSRIHGTPREKNFNPPSWHEIGRPQIHGYDMASAEFLDNLGFVSIADEKVVRVFEAPLGFVSTVEALNISSFTPEQKKRPEAANVPPLGLSNKAVNEKHVGLDPYSHSRRPLEGELAASTLWPEVEKLFGHGYESIALAVSHSRKLVATACKSTSPEHAGLRLHSIVDGWIEFGSPLMGHALTVTRIAFSPDDSHILSVSRDRTWRLFQLAADGSQYLPLQHDKSHGRIIWDCSWARTGDMFATASRDKTVKIWRKVHDSWTLSATIKMAEAATSVDFSPHDDNLLATGLENGQVSVYSLGDDGSWSPCWNSDTSIGHLSQINRISWRPSNHAEGLYLTTCSDDGAVRVILLNGNS